MLIYILPEVLSRGVLAVVLAEPAADIMTTVTNAVYFSRFVKKKFFTNEKLRGGMLR